MKPVTENNLFGDQFFLTRQSANLMEDFAREIRKGSSLFLLYGIGSVGKSRLLGELTKRGIENHKFCWINFKSCSVESSATSEDSSSDTDSFVDEIKELMEAADASDVILADHFELASNKAKHQLFQSWATDGTDKNINLAIATTTGSFSEVRQLAQQYKAKIKSFQLMPCSMAEVEAFLSFYLFPDSPLNSLSIPSEIKKQLRGCNGILGKVIEVADQHGSQVSIKPETASESKYYLPYVAGSLLLIAVASGIFYQYRQPNISDDGSFSAPTEKTITIISDNEDVVSINRPEPGSIDSGDETHQSTSDPLIVEQEQESALIPDSEIPVSADVAANADLKVESETAANEPESVSSIELDTPLGENIIPPVSRYQRDLDNSLKWIEGQDKSRGTIQIMTVSFDSFNDGAYHRYLEKLKLNKIDVSKINIYQTIINNSVVYGVIFGDYASRREAGKNINQLPAGLQVSESIPRSIGGIWNEINKF